MTRYVVFHDYGPDGWKIVAEVDSIAAAVRERERDLANAGGDVRIFEQVDIFLAYAQAAVAGTVPARPRIDDAVRVPGAVTPDTTRLKQDPRATAGPGEDIKYTPEELELIGKNPVVLPGAGYVAGSGAYEAREVRG